MNRARRDDSKQYRIVALKIEKWWLTVWKMNHPRFRGLNKKKNPLRFRNWPAAITVLCNISWVPPENPKGHCSFLVPIEDRLKVVRPDSGTKQWPNRTNHLRDVPLLVLTVSLICIIWSWKNRPYGRHEILKNCWVVQQFTVPLIFYDSVFGSPGN